MVSSGELANEGADLGLRLILHADGGGSAPTTIYLGLATASIADTDTLATITECADATYTREAVVFGAPADDSGVQKVSNSGTVVFGPFTSGGIAITHAFITDASTGTSGDLIFRIDLGTTKYTNAGEVLTVNIGDLKIGLE